MSETNRAKFLSTAFQLEFEGTVFDFKGMVSEMGITKVQVVGRSPPQLEGVFGNTAKIYLGRLTLQGSMWRHFAGTESFLEIRFVGMDESQKTFLRGLMELEGVHPGWTRRNPRIPVKVAEQSQLPVISLCVLRFVGQEILAPVTNFSLGGLRLELDGAAALKDAKVGMVVHCDLMTNAGEVIQDFLGEIKNLSIGETVGPMGRQPQQSIGIGFREIGLRQKRQFHDFIKNICLELKRRERA